MIEYFLPNASSFGGDIDYLFEFITYIIGFWFFLTIGIFFYFIFKFRRKNGVNAQYVTGDEHRENRWVHWPHYAVIAFDVLIIVVTVRIWIDVKIDLPEAQEKIRVVGQQWSWIFVHSGPDGKLDTADDIATVNDLHVKVDTTYHFELQSKDVMHDFSVPVFRLKQDAIPGRTITGWFKPTLTGEWDIQCAEMCGIGHGLMGARITVESEEDYDQWIAQQEMQKTDTALAITTKPLEGEFANRLDNSFQQTD